MEGVGAHIIADELNAMGSVPNRSAKWSRNTVRDILRNPTYAGKVAWNRVKRYKPTKNHPRPRAEHQKMEDWIMVDGLHPLGGLGAGAGDTQGETYPIRQPRAGGQSYGRADPLRKLRPKHAAGRRIHQGRTQAALHGESLHSVRKIRPGGAATP